MTALLSGLSGFAVEQDIAAFALHALWQVPVLAGAAALAISIGRPHVRVAHALWVATLALCVLAPAVSTVAGHRAAVEAARASAEVSISYEATVDIADLPPMQRQPAWKLALRRHVLSPSPFAFTLTARVARSIAWAYLVVAFAFATRLFVGWRRTRRLVRASSEQALPAAIADALQRQCDAIGCEPPQAAMTDDLPGPALAGVLQPTLLMPADATAQMSSAEIDAVLAHELAHLRRGDPMLHAACSLLLLPVSFHPAAAWAGRRVRQTREMACDAEAAERLGSAAEYAHALLQVAERSGGLRGAGAGLGLFGMGLFGLGLFDSEVLRKAPVRDGLLRQGRGPATAGLQLFGTAGAMEERMQTMMNLNPSERGAKRAARTVAAVSLAAVAVMAAAMVQVQPALAHAQDAPQATAQAAANSSVAAQDDNIPALIGGEHAREQLRNARHQLADAQKNSSSDVERSRLAAAQEVIATAEHELAAASGHDGPGMHIDVRGFPIDAKLPIDMEKMQADAERVRAQVESPGFKAWVEKQKADAERMRAQFNSPEFKAQMEKQRAKAERMAAQMNSPEFKAQFEKQRADADRMRAQFDSPEFKARMEKQREEAERVAAQMNSPEFRAKIDAQIKEAQRLSREASRMMARNEMPFTPNFAPVPKAAVAAQNARKTVQIDGKVLAANLLVKTQPVYPQLAKDTHTSGAVVVHVLVNEVGDVEDAKVTDAPSHELAESAIQAVMRWKYRPYLLNGKPTAVESTITVNYSFEGEPATGPVSSTAQDPQKPVKVESGILAGQILTKVQPRYPPSAKAAHISGSVVMHAITDETGKVAQLSLISSPDQALTESAMDVVRQWTYRPYLLNGKPTQVDTNITVNFSFGG